MTPPDLKNEELEVLIAVLTFAEAEAQLGNDAIARAIDALRVWRSALLREYIQLRINQQTVAAERAK